MGTGAFITLEGGDGAGKTTQAALLADALESRRLHVVRVHEPGGTDLGERVRSVLLDSSTGDIDSTAELMLYEAARAQLVTQVIRPALADGAVVVCDRFADSSVAYQGFGREIGAGAVCSVNALATGGLVPDRTVLLDIDPSVGMGRALGRSGAADRMEAAGDEFHVRVCEGFRDMARDDPARWRVVDASQSEAEVAAAVFAAVEDVLGDAPAGDPARDGGR